MIGEIFCFEFEFDDLVVVDVFIEVFVDGFEWLEGLVWVLVCMVVSFGYFLFSDILNNCINKWLVQEGFSVFFELLGYMGEVSFMGLEFGINGLMFDVEGNLVMCVYGDCCVKFMILQGEILIFVDCYQEKCFNSLNDLVFYFIGVFYFIDFFYGLFQCYEDFVCEFDWCGVYCLNDGELIFLIKEMM